MVSTLTSWRDMMCEELGGYLKYKQNIFNTIADRKSCAVITGLGGIFVKFNL